MIQVAILWVLAVFFIFAGLARLTPARKALARIVPKGLPYPMIIVGISGALEVLGGIGLLVGSTSKLAGICLILFLIAVFPANIIAAQRHFPYSNPLWVRTLGQVVLIALIGWVSL